MINELIEQIGGRDRLEFIAEDCADAMLAAAPSPGEK